MKIKVQVKMYKNKMDQEQLDLYLKAKKQGNGMHKNKKAYDRKKDKKIV